MRSSHADSRHDESAGWPRRTELCPSAPGENRTSESVNPIHFQFRAHPKKTTVGSSMAEAGGLPQRITLAASAL